MLLDILSIIMPSPGRDMIVNELATHLMGGQIRYDLTDDWSSDFYICPKCYIPFNEDILSDDIEVCSNCESKIREEETRKFTFFPDP